LTQRSESIIIITMRIGKLLQIILVLVLGIGVFARSETAHASQTERIRTHTRDVEFDYLTWVINAFGVKIKKLALSTIYYIPEENHSDLKMDYLHLLEDIRRLEAHLRDIYADPNITDPETASIEVRRQLDELYEMRNLKAPVAEAVLQRQVAAVASEFDLAPLGQTVPPVLYHNTPIPMALVISPRHEIRKELDISLLPGLPVDKQASIEDHVDGDLDVSSLVVPIGGIALYPTMVMETTDIVWLAEVVAHEWIHNYFMPRPVGFLYFTDPAIRTMNETAATIAGKEMGLRVIERYYPEFMPEPHAPELEEPAVPIQPETPPEPVEPPRFDFRSEMHETRIQVDELLAAGRVDEAEEYMEERRHFLWEHGYRIRKLNQAYFAFYGAYADTPRGPAGEDPVGEAVRTLRAQSPNLADFLIRISWMSSFDQLQQAIQAPNHTQ
jgi:hypothetical protein